MTEEIKSIELEDDALENVSGGHGRINRFKSVFECLECGRKVCWNGDYSQPGRTDVPYCHGKPMSFCCLRDREDN